MTMMAGKRGVKYIGRLNGRPMKRNDWMRPDRDSEQSAYDGLVRPGFRDAWALVARQLVEPRSQFADERTWRLYKSGDCPPAWRPARELLLRKLDMIQAAATLEDLAGQGGGLEIVLTDTDGLWSIDIDGRLAISFQWIGGAPSEIRILD